MDQRRNNLDPTFKNETNFDVRFSKLIQHQSPTLKERCNKVKTTLHSVDIALSQCYFNFTSTMVKTISKPIGLLISANSNIDN